jgi:hypothetical protein
MRLSSRFIRIWRANKKGWVAAHTDSRAAAQGYSDLAESLLADRRTAICGYVSTNALMTAQELKAASPDYSSL